MWTLLKSSTYGNVVKTKIFSSLWVSLISLRTPLICTISPNEPCFIIKIFDICYLNLVNQFSIKMANKSKKILSEISAGELLDKISILEIKIEKIMDKNSLNEINKEYKILKNAQNSNIETTDKIEKLFKEIKEINTNLWDIEDRLRICEKNKDFGKNFTELARRVYLNNDKRSKIKLEINKILGSNIREIKQYVNY